MEDNKQMQVQDAADLINQMALDGKQQDAFVDIIDGKLIAFNSEFDLIGGV
jgi:hypothetical protein